MKTRIFSFTAIAAMCAMPIITEAEENNAGNLAGQMIEKFDCPPTPEPPVSSTAYAIPGRFTSG